MVHAYENGLLKPYERKISQLDLDGNIIKTFDSGKKAEDETKISAIGIVKVCRGYRNTAGGFKWKYFDTNEREQIHLNKPNKIEMIKEFPDYSVTDDGRVYTSKMKRYMKFQTNADRYLTVQLCKVCDGIRIKKDFLVHRLVAITFIDNPENKPEINHINSDKTDNRVSNLEWNTRSENQIHKNKYIKLKNKQ